MKPEQVIAAIEALMAAPKPQDALAVLAEHTDAFNTATALELFDKNIARFQDDPETVALLANRRGIVRAFQSLGKQGAEAVMQGHPPEGVLINAWLGCAGWDDAFRFLEANDDILLADATHPLLEHAAQTLADDPHGGPKIGSYRAMVDIARDHGLVEARRWLCRQILPQVNELPPAERDRLYPTLINLTDPNDEPEAWVAVNINYGTLLRELDRPNDAIERFEAALKVLSVDQMPEHYAGAHRSLGNVYIGSEASNAALAIEHYEQALQVTTIDNDPINYLHMQHMLGTAHSLLGASDQAAEHLRRALAVAAEHNPDQWAQVAADLADQLMDDYGATRQRSLRSAIDYLTRALAVLDPETDATRWATGQRNLGMAYRDIEDHDRSSCLEHALAHTRQALNVWTAERDSYRWAQVQHNLGTIYFQRSHGDVADNLNQSAAHYQRALSVHTRDRHPDDWALTSAALGMTSLRQADFSDAWTALSAAQEQIESALAHWLSYGDDHNPRSGSFCAEAYNALGGVQVEMAQRGYDVDLSAAIDNLEQALKLYTELGLAERARTVEMNLTGAFAALARSEPAALERATRSAERALAATDRATDPYSWAIFQRNHAALLSQSGNPQLYGPAISALEDALTVFTREDFLAEHCKTQGFVGHLKFEQRDWRGALQAYEVAIGAVSDVLQGIYTQSSQEQQIAETSLFFVRAAYCLLELGQPNAALVMLDRGKGRALSMSLSTTALLRAAAGTDSGAQLREAEHQLAALEAEMRAPLDQVGRRSNADLGPRLAAVKKELNRLIAASAIAAPADLELAQILATAPTGGALVALLVTTHGAVAFVVPVGATELTSEHIVRTPLTNEQLQKLLLGTESAPGLLRAYFKLRLTNDAQSHTRAHEKYASLLLASCSALWRHLMAPVYERLAQLDLAPAAPIYLLPQGGLGVLPLHAAYDKRHSLGSPGCWPLLERYSVSYAPSAYSLHHADQTQSGQPVDSVHENSWFGAINPTLDLEFADIEAKIVTELVGRQRGWTTRSLRAGQATNDAVTAELNQHRYLHFSCHGTFNFADPARSSLSLANGDRLELAELMGPEINLSRSRLIVLSACETGMTEVRESPDEYIGLPATFLRAGAPAVLSTLWAVQDVSAAMLISQFYRYHLVDEEAPANALRRAQLWLANAGRAELSDWLDAAQRILSSAIAAGQHDIENSLRRLEQLRALADNAPADQRPFYHPWFWAAFALTGA